MQNLDVSPFYLSDHQRTVDTDQHDGVFEGLLILSICWTGENILI